MAKSRFNRTTWVDPNCPPEIVRMIFNRRADDERIVAQRRWSAPIKPPKPQKPCDDGLFSDTANQKEMKL